MADYGRAFAWIDKCIVVDFSAGEVASRRSPTSRNQNRAIIQKRDGRTEAQNLHAASCGKVCSDLLPIERGPVRVLIAARGAPVYRVHPQLADPPAVKCATLQE